MRKIFCDYCEAELTRDNTLPIHVSGKLELKTTHKNKPAHIKIDLVDVGDICGHCIIDVVNKFDDRPRAA